MESALNDSIRPSPPLRPRAAEFFAGIGLVKTALEQAEIDVVFANDIEPVKQRLYKANHSDEHFVCADVRGITGAKVPDIEIATASFPCTDLSLAGNRAGLSGRESSMFWEFARVLDEMSDRRPSVVMLENVPSFATSRGGRDLEEAVQALNQLGYGCDIFLMDARWFVPQSRPRLFVLGSAGSTKGASNLEHSPLRPKWLVEFMSRNRYLSFSDAGIPMPPLKKPSLRSVVERLHPADSRWWETERSTRFLESLSPIQAARLRAMCESPRKTWATAYRRTRRGQAVWEIRADALSGCLRTARGGSSRQALVEAGQGQWKVRWMTPREYARLQGAGGYKFGEASENQVLFGFGDAVCVPVVAWIAEHGIHNALKSAEESMVGLGLGQAA